MGQNANDDLECVLHAACRCGANRKAGAMEVWVLIAFLGCQAGNLSVEFTSRQRCELAALQLMKGKPNSDEQRAVCVQK